jgi:hypothetical protein
MHQSAECTVGRLVLDWDFHKIHAERNLCYSFQSRPDDIRSYLKQGLGFVAIVREALADAG